MDDLDFQAFLENNAIFKIDGKKTEINNFSVIASLDANPNRLNSSWIRAQYIVLKGERSAKEITQLIKRWLELPIYHDQYLLINKAGDGRHIYDHEGIDLGLAKSKLEKSSCVYQIQFSFPLQRIYYGAPGTGKSNEIKILTGEGKNGIKFGNDFTFRTTFHPDSDYSSFVGAYKPTWDDKKDKIIYEFRPQTFLKAYIAAWTNPDQNVALVIEEINRGNCAQIFGDIFQLLDRDSHGLSKYPIEADIDMQKSLNKAFSGENQYKKTIPDTDKELVNNYYENHYTNAFQQIKEGKILTLPKNLSILATMNTSDQSLFPMDSAFKRRWEWMYQPIVEGVDSESKKKLEWKIQIDGYESIDWWEFLKRINRVISNLTSSEDKQLGYFFCLPDLKTEDHANNTLISTGLFVNKVIFYLWNDVFKDYAYDDNCCRSEDGSKTILFADFHKGNEVNLDVLKHFFETLRIDDEESLLTEKNSEKNTDDTLVNDTDTESVEDD